MTKRMRPRSFARISVNSIVNGAALGRVVAGQSGPAAARGADSSPSEGTDRPPGQHTGGTHPLESFKVVSQHDSCLLLECSELVGDFWCYVTAALPYAAVAGGSARSSFVRSTRVCGCCQTSTCGQRDGLRPSLGPRPSHTAFEGK